MKTRFNISEDLYTAMHKCIRCGQCVYGNEDGVGQGIKKSGVPREEIFVTSKVWNRDQGYDQTLAAFDVSLKRLGMEYVDLYLIHWPVKDKFKETWRALETIYDSGRARTLITFTLTSKYRCGRLLNDALDGMERFSRVLHAILTH